MMTSSGFVYDEHGFQNSTAFANDFQSEAATLRLHLNRCSYTFEVLSIRFGFQNSTTFANDFQSCSNFALALKPMFLHFCGFEHLSWLPKLNCLCQRFSKWSSNFGLALKPMFLHFCGFKHWSWFGSYTFVVSELQFATVLLLELNCLCQWFSKQSSSITNNFAKN